MSDSHHIPRLFVGNFDFEHHLAAGGEYQPSGTVRRLGEEMAGLWVVAAEDGDQIWTPAAIEEGFFELLAAQGLAKAQPVADESAVRPPVLVSPWGWTEDVRRWARMHGWSLLAPEQPAVRLVNSRTFSWQCEQTWHVGLASAASIGSVDELHNHLQDLPKFVQRWVLKADFGMSARERWLGRGRSLSEEAANWMSKRLQQNGVVFFEPWVERVEEAGVQFTIDSDGRTVFCGLTPLLTDALGAYRGSRFGIEADSLPQWQSAIEVGRRVAERAAKIGYYGPLGIDAVHYRDEDDSVRLRPLQDVNARYTMGRLSLGLRRLLPAGHTGSWLHVRWPNDTADAARVWLEDATAHLPQSVRWIRTSPFVVGGIPTRYGTVVLLAPDPESLTAAEGVLVNLRAPHK